MATLESGIERDGNAYANPDGDSNTYGHAHRNSHRDTNTHPVTDVTSSSGLSATFRYDSKWNDGWCGTLVVKNNTSTKVSKHTMGFDLPTNVSLSDKVERHVQPVRSEIHGAVSLG